MPLTQKRLKRLLHYDVARGIFRWRVSRGPRVNAGDVAGTRGGKSISITIDGKKYRANRLAILYTRGRWPKAVVDHRNQDRRDLRFRNLRECSKAESCANNRRRPGISGFIGAQKFGRRYRSSLVHIYKRINLGLFDSAERAHKAFVRAHKQFNKEYSRFNAT